MAKPRTVFVCRTCGAIQTKWMGKCPDCGAWDALEQETVERSKVDPRGASLRTWAGEAAGRGAEHEGEAPGAGPGGGAGAGHGGGGMLSSASPGQARSIAEIDSAATLTRLATGIGELDRVLGGGFVPGSAVLLGGDPGIGKSTLLLQAAAALAGRGTRTLYVSSEESAEQVKLRAARLVGGGEGARGERGGGMPAELFLLADTSLARILDQAARVLAEKPRPVLVVDSIQMIYKADLDAFPGSLTQLRRCCSELVYMAKATAATVVLVGHVTKDGMLAGPRLLEHLVDAVLYFEGDRHHAHRIVRAVKNRYGTTLELGLFEMTGEGLRQAPDGAAAPALAGDGKPRPGTVVCPVQTGTRCLMVEIQALTATGFLGAAKRKSSGLDANRLAMLIAVLEQHAGLRLADRDIFASSVGGVRVGEPAGDLALLLAIAGAHYKRSLPAGAAAVGEVGLGGEVRPVAQLEARVREAARLGYTTLLVPRSRGAPMALPGKNVTLVPVANVDQAIEQLA